MQDAPRSRQHRPSLPQATARGNAKGTVPICTKKASEIEVKKAIKIQIEIQIQIKIEIENKVGGRDCRKRPRGKLLRTGRTRRMGGTRRMERERRRAKRRRRSGTRK
jgi:hypothetical protein